ncbi:MAG: marine proteobacterial sortase target protein [Rhodobacterales bacterium]|nr:marine proteobacterial sortase target protein [Rhodobacterales bacterium]
MDRPFIVPERLPLSRPPRRRLMPVLGRALVILGAAAALFFMALDAPRAEGPAPAAPAATSTPPAPPAPGLVDAAALGDGGLFLPGQDGLFRPAPLLATQIEADVSGLVARYTVKHTFRNPDSGWVEGIYVFPLPEDSAVDKMRMTIGERIIEGRIEEKAAARKIYDQARREGRRAGLVEQERPNIFTASVANIGPGETVTVEIRFQETLRLDGDTFRLRFPLVIGPRYIPGGQTVAAVGGRGWGVNTDQVPDAERITPPVRRPEQGLGNPVALDVTLDPGFPLAALASPSHDVTVTENADGTRHVTLKGDAVPADRDFVLEWKAQPGATPTAGLFRETVDGKDYLLVMMMPPVGQARDVIKTKALDRPREVIFVIDVSGSMHGLSIEGAKTALHDAMDRLTPRDRFNIVTFSNSAAALFPAARPADAPALRQASAFVDALEAQGGTEMMGALDLALDGRHDLSRIRQVVLLTDGAVGNESALLTRIEQAIGDSRLFTVGIGSAPNAYLMTEAARAGRGTYTYVEDAARVDTGMDDLLRKLEHPVLTDLRLTLTDATGAEIHPDPLPDLYAGEPLVATLRLDEAKGDLRLAGRFDGGLWETVLPLTGGRESPGVGKLWARGRIATLMAGLSRGEDPDVVRKAVLHTALTHQLVSRYTSLVAVDVTPVRPADQPLATGEVPTNLPHGWSHEHVFGPDAPGAVPQPAPTKAMPAPGKAMKVAPTRAMAPASAPAGTSAGVASGAPAQDAAMAPANRAAGISLSASGGHVTGLPQGATPAQWLALTGTLSTLAGLALLVLLRRRRPAA